MSEAKPKKPFVPFTYEERQKLMTAKNCIAPKFNKGALYKNKYRILRRVRAPIYAGKINIYGTVFELFGFVYKGGITLSIQSGLGINIDFLQYAYGRYKGVLEYQGDNLRIYVRLYQDKKEYRYGDLIYQIFIFSQNEDYEAKMREIDEANKPQKFNTNELPF